MSELSNEVRLSPWEVAISGLIRLRIQSDAIRRRLREETRGASRNVVFALVREILPRTLPSLSANRPWSRIARHVTY